ncbi:MAG: hypothetical protein QOH30_2686 [Baekduia sp.]|nr:hypothetical protein [Baekduia sp.]
MARISFGGGNIRTVEQTDAASTVQRLAQARDGRALSADNRPLPMGWTTFSSNGAEVYVQASEVAFVDDGDREENPEAMPLIHVSESPFGRR